MRLKTPGSPHLTYCTNVHAGERWSDVRATLAGPVAAVAKRVAAGMPFGVGLRLGGEAARALGAPWVREELVDLLRAMGAYCFTVNAFPHGAFHGTRVKERVYRPDWRERRRIAYTRDVAEVLAAILPADVDGSISTVPGADMGRSATSEDRDAIAVGVLEAAAHLVEIERRAGKTIVLALEPEPRCMLETAADAAAFHRDHLLSPSAMARFARAIGADLSAAERALRRHVGVCLDACHVAVAFETAEEALAILEREGIAVAKVQLSAGVEIEGAAAAEQVLPALDDGVYLHQTTVATPDGLFLRYLDLDDALARAPEGVWRVHAHVPIDRDPVRPFGTTRRHLESLLARVRERAVSAHLEVETYTWSVLPRELRGEDLVDDIVRELSWTRASLEGGR